MTAAFADSGYWIALINPEDRLHERANRLSKAQPNRRIITTDLVFVEVLNNFAKQGSQFRRIAASFIKTLQRDRNVVRVNSDPLLFEKALERYLARPDKAWSMTDCASFIIMEEQALTEAFAHDIHFEQAGFQALMRP